MARLPFGRRTGGASVAGGGLAGEQQGPAGEARDSGLAHPPSPPSRMRGREPLYGYATAAVIAAGAVLNLVVTKGKGAPAHPLLWPSYVAVVLAAGLTVSIRWRNRLVSPFVAIFGGMFDTLGRGPNSLSIAHYIVIFGAFGFAMALTMRQRRDQKALGLLPGRGRRGAATATGGAGRRGAAASTAGRKGAAAEDAQKKPSANRRYTPPKYATKATSGRGRARR